MKKMLSVRLAPDGFSFSCPMDPEAVPEGFYAVEGYRTLLSSLRELVEAQKLKPENFPGGQIEVDTNKLVLVPNSIFEEGSQEGYLAVNNIACGPDETVVISPAFGVRAVMVASCPVVEFFRGYWGDKLTFTSPIITSIYRAKRSTVEINLTRHFAYVTIIEDKLDYAEVFPCESPADLLYYMNRLGAQFDLQNSTTFVTGHQAEAALKRLAKYYKSVIGDAHYKR